VGENEIEINKKAREIGDFMLNYCIVKGVVCSNICLINEQKTLLKDANGQIVCIFLLMRR
jgi:hypothetical protein